MAVEIPRQADLVGCAPLFPRATGPAWFWWRATLAGAGRWTLVIRCPEGHHGTLSSDVHQVAPDGTVSPSLHFKGLCDGVVEWHVAGRLLGWSAEDEKRWA